MQVYKTNHGQTVLVVHEPGNMTRYVGTAHKILAGPVGLIDHWVVSFPVFGSSAMFSEGMTLHLGYVMEKLGSPRTGGLLSECDVSEMMKIMAVMIPNTTCVPVTDDTGHMLSPTITAGG